MRTQRQWPELWRGHSTAWQVRNIQLSDDVIE
jgi:hypothetical protein